MALGYIYRDINRYNIGYSTVPQPTSTGATYTQPAYTGAPHANPRPIVSHVARPAVSNPTYLPPTYNASSHLPMPTKVTLDAQPGSAASPDVQSASSDSPQIDISKYFSDVTPTEQAYLASRNLLYGGADKQNLERIEALIGILRLEKKATVGTFRSRVPADSLYPDRGTFRIETDDAESERFYYTNNDQLPTLLMPGSEDPTEIFEGDQVMVQYIPIEDSSLPIAVGVYSLEDEAGEWAGWEP